MPNYKYKSVNQNGKVLQGTLVALSESDLENRLLQDGLTLIASSLIKESQIEKFLSKGSVKPRLVVEFYYRLAQTLELGLPLLSALSENAKLLPSKPLRKAIGEIQVAIEGGNTLFESMGRFENIFGKLDLAIVKMGEQTGVLPQSMKDLAEFLEWKEDIRSTIKRATIYPSFVIIVILAVIGVWVGYVLPQMAKMLIEMQIDLPTMTRIVLALSGFIQTNIIEIILVCFFSGLCFYLFQKHPKGGLIVHKYFLKFPLFGPIALNIAVARLSHNFATMYASGISINSIFEILSKNVLGNRYLEECLSSAYRDIQRGDSIAAGFENADGFPPLLVGAIKNGETTGTIDAAFKRLGDYYDTEVKRSVQGMINAIEPITILLLGGVFGLIALSIMLPLYDVIGEFQ